MNSFIELDSPLVTATQRNEILNRLAGNGFAIVRGLVDAERLGNSVSKLTEYRLRTSYASGLDPLKNLKNTVVTKFVLGGGAQAHYYVPRCLQLVYNTFQSPDQFALHSLLNPAVLLRNRLIEYRDDFCTMQSPNHPAYFTAVRYQFYPSGGGFFAQHQDVVLEAAQSSAGLKNFLQIIVMLNARGFGYTDGGAFLIDKTKTFIDLEDDAQPGDIIIYDGRSTHGVKEIDISSIFDLKSRNGRWVALVSLYAKQ